MKNKNVIDPDCLPMRSPLLFFATLWLLLDRLGIPSWGWGVYWTLFALVGILYVSSQFEVNHEKLPGFGEQS